MNDETQSPPDDVAKRPPQFGLRTLVIAQGLVAVVVAMFVTHRTLGFLALLALTYGVNYIRVRPEREPLRRAGFDLLTVIVMPIVGILVAFGGADPLGDLAFLVKVTWLPMLTLVLWLAWDVSQKPVGPYLRGLAAGVFLVWGFFVGVVGLLASVLILFSGIPPDLGHAATIALSFAAVGFLTVMVSSVLFRAMERVMGDEWSRQPTGVTAGSFALGMLLAIVLPLAVASVISSF